MKSTRTSAIHFGLLLVLAALSAAPAAFAQAHKADDPLDPPAGRRIPAAPDNPQHLRGEDQPEDRQPARADDASTQDRSTSDMDRGQDTRRQTDSAGDARDRAPSDASQRRIVIGRLVDVRDIAVESAQDKHRLLKLQSKSGRQIIVDMGVPDRVLGFRHGDLIAAVGHDAQLNGRSILFAAYLGKLQSVGDSGMAEDER